MAQAFTHFVVSVMARDQASVLSAYVNGSPGARSWEHATTIWAVLVLVLPLVAAPAGPVTVNEMGDELADALGARAAPTRTAAVVLHDLAQAARSAPRLVLMDRGRVVAGGPPGQVVTARMVEEVFGLACDVVPDPRTRTPLVIPHERAPSRPR
ncbi:iron chelate uptake ABC transporter family permease subunit [Nocardiopsis quinghaiensis]|uniref:iron chelate uptake ABC transporter family permease subunit n=1 Tax=Nocardiopsis quinghaiensis TaxID=464995 RepID=UPI0021E0B5F6|nr:iron chelate uptake ABC transporter family permease subunit [Nocardiopsis quinghaiensis]